MQPKTKKPTNKKKPAVKRANKKQAASKHAAELTAARLRVLMDSLADAYTEMGDCATCPEAECPSNRNPGLKPDPRLFGIDPRLGGGFTEPGANAELANSGLANGRVVFPGGTQRSARKPLYHLVPIELLRAVADTRAHGDLKYEPGNWKRGDRAFFVDCVNHTIEHLYGAVDLEDIDGIVKHLGHAACNIAFMLWAVSRGIITREDFERAAVVLEEATKASHAGVLR